MPRFRKKPIEIEAAQWFPGNGCPGVRDDFPTDKSAAKKLCGCTLVGGPHAGKPHVHPTRSVEGILVKPGDWIIKEQVGYGYYPCASDVFTATYDPISE